MGDAERGPESRVRFRGGDGRGLVDKGDLPQDGSGGLRHTGTKRAPNHLDSLLSKCGFLLHPAHEGGFIFRALYSGCLVQKEETNYRLEIRMLQKGAKRLNQSDHYIMKCPVTMWRLGEQRIRCHPSFIQVSRPLPPQMDGGQTPWLLSLRGELVASLEDASLMGLDVDIGATTVTIQSSRQELLQRQKVWNTSLELLPLWLVSGSYAYSLKAACPLASSQPGSEISVHIPKQRLGLVRRGAPVEESLSPRLLRVHQSNTFTVTEDRDFVVVSIPAPMLLQDQPCPETRESPGTRAFYRVDLSLAFAEMVSPVHWTMENFFQCVGSREKPLDSAAKPRTTPPTLFPGWETASTEVPSAASPQFQIPQMAALDEPLQRAVHQPVKESIKAKPQLYGTGSAIHANKQTGAGKLGVCCFSFPQHNSGASWPSDSSKQSRLNSTPPYSSYTFLRAHGGFPGWPQTPTIHRPVSHCHDHTFVFRSPLSSVAFLAIWMGAWLYHGMEARGHLAGVRSCLPPCGTLRTLDLEAGIFTF
ncbi:hypothetical protein H671_2g7850 [Cricetulus griseus]|nr:hypothetical protein H671_2g7850 [Cricetulus griseus]